MEQKIKVECSLPELDCRYFTFYRNENFIPSIGDAFYITQFISEEDSNYLKKTESRIPKQSLYEVLDDELVTVKNRSWLKDKQGNTRCLLILEF